MAEWADAAATALAAGPTALVTVLATEGSAPRGAGTRMVVTADSQVGTVGGGALEWRLVEQARAVLARSPGTWRVQDYPLGPLLGQCCGGRVRVLVERLAEADWCAGVAAGKLVGSVFEPDRVQRGGGGGAIVARGPLPVAGDRFVEPDDAVRRPLYLFGAGHVGRAIADKAVGLPFDLAWFDSRADAAERPGVMLLDEDALVACAADASAEAAVLILTHDHALDYRLVVAALGASADFVGLIGSATKRARFVSRLAAAGVDAARLTCPIGAAGVIGKEPAVIAVAALAQLLALRMAA